MKKLIFLMAFVISAMGLGIGVGIPTAPVSATILCTDEVENNGDTITKEQYKEQKEFEKDREGFTKEETKTEIDACKELYKQGKDE